MTNYIILTTNHEHNILQPPEGGLEEVSHLSFVDEFLMAK